MKKLSFFIKPVKNTEGFLLIEVAIALLIIGLLIGGVLKGKELLETSKLQAVIKNLETYRVATQLFQDRYGFLPGDFPEATTYLNSTLKDGNGNGAVEDYESSQFWANLYVSGFIQASTKEAHQEKIGGCVTVVHTPAPDLPGNWFLLGERNGSKNDGALLTPIQAKTLCQKMDNPNPNEGSVQVKDGANVPPGSCIDQGQFNGKTKNPACVVYVAL